jgi:outer membrane receptor protein involved in Fe transport
VWGRSDTDCLEAVSKLPPPLCRGGSPANSQELQRRREGWFVVCRLGHEAAAAQLFQERNMFKTGPIAAALLSVLPRAAWPQDAQELQRVEVTGSRIKRIDAETPSPVQVITREQIERSGAQSVTEILTRSPAANVGSFDENAISSFTPGAGSASLRGLGPQATLVLINGRRVSPFGFASGSRRSTPTCPRTCRSATRRSTI